MAKRSRPRSNFVTLEEAAEQVGKTTHNIRDYLQRGRIGKFNAQGQSIGRAKIGELRVSLSELKAFLKQVQHGNHKHALLGVDHELGFYDVPEFERTKHVHRLHPYLGKFIPQLVEWFLRRHFQTGDLILDPFMGSGTTLVQANELDMHSIGVDVSPFNCLMARVKTAKYELGNVREEILGLEQRLTDFSRMYLTASISPSAQIQSQKPISARERQRRIAALSRLNSSQYLAEWFAPRALLEMIQYREWIADYEYQELLQVILSRAVRSSRLVPHFDLATPKAPLPVGKTYWCRKHKRECTPIDNCLSKIHAYSEDTARRIESFHQLRSRKHSIVLQGDSRSIDLRKGLTGTALARKKISGILTSPPYVGQIDYHEQHIYAYELFGFPRQDGSELGRKAGGKSRRAQSEYVEGIAAVFRNVARFLDKDAPVLIVANDRFRLYPEIARRADLEIQKEYRRAVTKRTEQGDDPYQETIFLMRKSEAN
jgi:DNA methylase